MFYNQVNVRIFRYATPIPKQPRRKFEYIAVAHVIVYRIFFKIEEVIGPQGFDRRELYSPKLC